MAYYRTPALNPDKNLQAYVIGLAIGDGNLSNPNNRATRLRITCDKKYPRLIKRIRQSLSELFPENKIGLIRRKANCVDVWVYSNHLEKLLGWKAADGSKFKQNVSTPKWIYESKKYKIQYLRGLIETDGSIYNDRGYTMVIFSTIIPKLAKNIKDIMFSLGFRPMFYKIKQNKTISGSRFKYQVRLSRNVEEFLDLIKK
ncbi:MAG: hypothetical protein HYT27_02770, partial [Parcubacteria group bacterium]|nr:hypothetical protein [Parcubacteria group bacterium]